MEPKLLIFWETGGCGDLIGGMWEYPEVIMQNIYR